MMLGSKGLLPPLIPDCSALRALTILKNIRNPLIFLRKMASYSCFWRVPRLKIFMQASLHQISNLLTLVSCHLVNSAINWRFNWGPEDASGRDHVRCGGGVCLSLPTPVEGCREGGIRPEWIVTGTARAYWSAQRNAKLVRDLAKHRRTPMSLAQLIPPTSPVQVIAGDVRLRRRFSRHRTWSVPDADCLQPQRGRDLVAATT